jgi:hypothetical protein
MTDDEIRAIVRQVLASRGVAQSQSPPQASPSHVRLTMVTPTAPGSPCIIEPTVGCNQCGYCVSMGH